MGEIRGRERKSRGHQSGRKLGDMAEDRQMIERDELPISHWTVMWRSGMGPIKETALGPEWDWWPGEEKEREVGAWGDWWPRRDGKRESSERVGDGS